MSTTPVKIEVVQPTPTFGKDLNDTERRVLQGVFAGKDNLEIALALGLSEGTVKQALHSTYRKFGIHSLRGLFPMLIAANMELRTGKLIEGVQ